MSQTRKRSQNDAPGSSPSPSKKPHHPNSPTPPNTTTTTPTFPSYLDTPDLPPKIRLLCQTLATTPAQSLESTLDDIAIRISTDDVESVLKLSYSYPGPAVKFFRWAGYRHLSHHHSPYSWNLVIDLLGKNQLFDAMWDAVKSMRSQSLLSLATFASVFSSYVVAGLVDEAIMTFEVMDQYGCPRDIVALNSLLSAICRDARTAKALEFFEKAKALIRPDADTYAILLEGWENEGDAANAHRTFGEMVIFIGWDPANVPAYDSFLNTLIKGPNGIREALKFLEVMRQKRCYPGMKFFRNALEECLRTGDAGAALQIWEEMAMRNGCVPDTHMYTTMIALQCHRNQLGVAQHFFDEMTLNGVFPTAETYNVMLQFLIKTRKLRDAAVLFDEMVKNECLPSHVNCESAIRVFLDSREPDKAIKVWKCMVANDISPLESSANLLAVELPLSYRLPEARKYAEDAIERGIKLNSSTLSKLKQSLVKAGKGDMYDDLLRKWKAH